MHEIGLLAEAKKLILSGLAWIPCPLSLQKKSHLLNTGTGAEADIRVDVTLHFTVVEAVCL